jgi:hypothetical protein
MTSLEVIIDDTHCLHGGVRGRGTDEAPAAPTQQLGQP